MKIPAVEPSATPLTFPVSSPPPSAIDSQSYASQSDSAQQPPQSTPDTASLSSGLSSLSSDQPINGENSEERPLGPIVTLFKLFSDETRLKIISLLAQTPEMNVRSMCELLKQSQPAVSHHLALLRNAGTIELRREGKHNFYRLAHHKLEEVNQWLQQTLGNKGSN
ncbi:MAG: metalloregulator ArsR/SmtB family transcription factor [Pirellulaceae bacterium]|nr:metalloregulator ArsR/SmtB family transcription factor [Pirellulaceae bacterium]